MQRMGWSSKRRLVVNKLGSASQHSMVSMRAMRSFEFGRQGSSSPALSPPPRHTQSDFVGGPAPPQYTHSEPAHAQAAEESWEVSSGASKTTISAAPEPAQAPRHTVLGAAARTFSAIKEEGDGDHRQPEQAAAQPHTPPLSRVDPGDTGASISHLLDGWLPRRQPPAPVLDALPPRGKRRFAGKPLAQCSPRAVDTPPPPDSPTDGAPDASPIDRSFDSAFARLRGGRLRPRPARPARAPVAEGVQGVLLRSKRVLC